MSRKMSCFPLARPIFGGLILLLVLQCKTTGHKGAASHQLKTPSPSASADLGDPNACATFYEPTATAPPVDPATLTLSNAQVAPVQVLPSSSLYVPKLVVEANPQADVTYYKMCNSRLDPKVGCIDGLLLMPTQDQPGYYGTYVYRLPPVGAIYTVSVSACVRGDRAASVQGTGIQILHPQQFPDLELYCGPAFSLSTSYQHSVFPNSVLAQQLEVVDAQEAVVTKALYAMVDAVQTYAKENGTPSSQLGSLAATLAQYRESVFPLFSSSLLDDSLAALQATSEGSAGALRGVHQPVTAGTCISNGQLVEALLSASDTPTSSTEGAISNDVANGAVLVTSIVSNALGDTALPPGPIPSSGGESSGEGASGETGGTSGNSGSNAGDASSSGSSSSEVGGGTASSSGDSSLEASGGTASSSSGAPASEGGSSTSGGSSHVNTGAIVGGVIGGLAILAVAVVVYIKVTRAKVVPASSYTPERSRAPSLSGFPPVEEPGLPALRAANEAARQQAAEALAQTEAELKAAKENARLAREDLAKFNQSYPSTSGEGITDADIQASKKVGADLEAINAARTERETALAQQEAAEKAKLEELRQLTPEKVAAAKAAQLKAVQQEALQVVESKAVSAGEVGISEEVKAKIAAKLKAGVTYDHLQVTEGDLTLAQRYIERVRASARFSKIPDLAPELIAQREAAYVKVVTAQKLLQQGQAGAKKIERSKLDYGKGAVPQPVEAVGELKGKILAFRLASSPDQDFLTQFDALAQTFFSARTEYLALEKKLATTFQGLTATTP